jgi:hypothetical protein
MIAIEKQAPTLCPSLLYGPAPRRIFHRRAGTLAPLFGPRDRMMMREEEAPLSAIEDTQTLTVGRPGSPA